MVQKEKRSYSIKGKLMAAIAMLLVAVVMVVSSTYAWFTLSTAPEVSGISTAVGANGALEIRLVGYDDQGNLVNGDGAVDASNPNIYWGNLVDLSNDAKYGTNKIVLYPSKLKEAAAGYINPGSTLLAPRYDNTGRVQADFDSTVAGIFDGEAFNTSDKLGFRALGVASGMSPRQLAWRTAKGNVSTYMIAARNAARNSLVGDNGSTLGTIAVKYAMVSDPTFNEAERAAVASMIQGLYASLEQVEDAYFEALIAYAASSLTGENDEAYAALRSVIDSYYTGGNALEKDASDLEDTIAQMVSTAETHGVTLTLPASFTNGVDKYKTALTAVAGADSELSALGTKASYSWDEISTPLNKLVNMTALKINGTPVKEVDKNVIVQAAMKEGGVQVQMGTGSGVYADVADLCGNYTASITINPYEATNIDIDVDAKMVTQSTVQPAHLQQIATVVGAESMKPKANAADAPITEFYGYIVDLVFRTNAANSNLLLQSDGIDRIYKDNDTNPDTMGGGATMTFDTLDANFTIDQVKALMSHIRIVFFDPADGQIYANARLDMEEANLKLGADGVTAKMYIVTGVTKYTYTDADSNTVTVYSNDGEHYYADADCTTATTLPENVALSAGTEVKGNKITALTQGVATNVSALVYLDGETITNADVAATAKQSMTGTVNFQFASDAELVPMENAALQG